MNPEPSDRYLRQIRLAEVGPEGQEKLRKASVLIIGAGGLGCPALQYLAAAGVGTLTVVDNDCVDRSNLHRQILYTESDIDKPKPIVVKERLAQINPFVTVLPVFDKFSKNNALEIMKGADLVLDCTDQFSTRYLISDAAVLLGKPVVYGAAQRFEGQVTVFNYRNGPTLRCLNPEPPHPLETPSCAETGVMGPVAGIIGAMQANEAIKIILETDGILSGNIFLLDALSFESAMIPLKRNPDAASVTTLKEGEDACLSDETTVRNISREELDNMLAAPEPALVIDLRDPEETSDPGFPCLRIPIYDLAGHVFSIPTDRPVVFYCRYGIKSVLAVNYLQSRHGFDNLFRLENS